MRISTPCVPRSDIGSGFASLWGKRDCARPSLGWSGTAFLRGVGSGVVSVRLWLHDLLSVHDVEALGLLLERAGQQYAVSAVDALRVGSERRVGGGVLDGVRGQLHDVLEVVRPVAAGRILLLASCGHVERAVGCRRISGERAISQRDVGGVGCAHCDLVQVVAEGEGKVLDIRQPFRKIDRLKVPVGTGGICANDLQLTRRDVFRVLFACGILYERVQSICVEHAAARPILGIVFMDADPFQALTHVERRQSDVCRCGGDVD